MLYANTHQAALAEKHLAEALRINEAALNKDDPNLGVHYHNGALVYLRLDQYDKAAQLNDRALAIAHKTLGPDHPESFGRLSLAAVIHYAQGKQTGVLSNLDTGLRRLRNYITQILSGLPAPQQLQFLEGNLVNGLNDALSIAVREANHQDYIDHSASWVLNAKGLAHQTVAQQVLAARDSADPQVKEQAKQLAAIRQTLANLSLNRPEPAAAEAHRKQLADAVEREQALAAAVARLAGRSSNANDWVELDAVRSALPADAVLIELIRFTPIDMDGKNKNEPYPPRYAAWLISKAEPCRLLDLGEAKPIEDAIAAFQATMRLAQSSDPEKNPLLQVGEAEATKQVDAALGSVAKILFEPLQPHLQKAKELIISPDSALWLVPWAALPVREEETQQYAIERWRLKYLVSGRELVTQKNAATTKPTRSLVFADPHFDLGQNDVSQATAALLRGNTTSLAMRSLDPVTPNRTLPKVARLPGTLAEATAISKPLQKFAGEEPILYSDRYALEAGFKAVQSPRVLVAATHGFFLPAAAGASGENPLVRCGLLLAGCNAKITTPQLDDGVLTGLEIVGCRLQGTELVVLSACETGLGEVRSGEGVAGLRQAFQLAGAKSVVSTLWQIPDRESAQLMSDFFANLATAQPQAEALRQAQLTTIHNRRERHGAAHPLFWAAWTVTGN